VVTVGFASLTWNHSENTLELIPPLEKISGQLVFVAPFTKADITETYIGWLNDPEIVRYSNQRFKKHTFDSCIDYFSSFELTPNRLFKIIKKQDQKMIGTMTAYVSVHHGTADLGLLVERSVWGQGIGLDAWQTLMNWLLGLPGVRKVTGGTARGNLAMLQIMKRSGMKLEAVRERQEVFDGQTQDLLYFGKFSDEL